jgi:hypothetical protein
MKRLLLLAYHFPPIGGAGVQRNAKLVRYLPEFGYEPTVVTGPGLSSHDRWAPIDQTMSNDVPGDVVVHRVSGPEPTWREGVRGRATRWLRLDNEWQRWWESKAVPLAVAAGRNADVVYASVAPYSTARAAIAVARALKKPLVFDLEDPWALDEMLIHETSLHARLELREMARALRCADAIVMNTPEAARRVRETFPELSSIPVTSVVNGYDHADFDGLATRRDDGMFRIVHTGSLHSELGAPRSAFRRLLGGAMDVNVLSRSLVFLRQALDELGAESPVLAGRIELHLAGRLTAGDRAVIDGLPGVREYGFLSHAETVDLLRSADLLFLPMHDVPAGRRVAIVPCKTYEYLAAQRPILAAVPDGDAHDLLSRSGMAKICRPTDVAAVKAALLEALANRMNGVAAVEPDSALLARLERRALTRDLVGFLETVDGGVRERPMLEYAAG